MRHGWPLLLLFACDAESRTQVVTSTPAAPAAAPAAAPEAAPVSAPVTASAAATAAAAAPVLVATPAAPAPHPADDVSWWCTCYARSLTMPVTACRKEQADCHQLERKVAAGGDGIMRGSTSYPCREVHGAHPGDALGSRATWKSSKKPGAWVISGACMLSMLPEEEPPDILKDESFAGLKLGLAEADVRERLGEPTQKEPAELREATGEFYIHWTYALHGLVLEFSSQKRSGPWTLASILAQRPSLARTSRGIGIGDPRSAVEAAYGKDAAPEVEPDPNIFFAGSVYWGLSFTFDAEARVERLFMGAGGE